MRPTTSVLFIFLLVLSCSNNKYTINKDNCRSFRITTESEISGFPSDAFQLDTFFIKENELIAFVNFGGGCEEHCFRLFWNKMLLESIPPQAVFTLSHDANNDMCRAMLREKLNFNINSFKEHLKKSGVKEVAVRIKDKSFLYKF